ncbi:glycoside hydrolase family 15 [Candidatus Woesearchaeota archaeon]|nr:glycoside hydrolase family 15 [Candidatus Woesearchaeota archaeon]
MIKAILRKLIARKLKELQNDHGLFSASPNKLTGYDKVWIRDNIYEALGLEAVNDHDAVVKTYRALLDLLRKHESKIDGAIAKRPNHADHYIHPRYCPLTLCEIPGTWGNKQNDAIGALLFKMADLERKGVKIIRNGIDLMIIRKLVDYLAAIEYWHDKDNGMWEENDEVHASSVGACVAGLKAIDGIVPVKKELIAKGEHALNALLPRESETKIVDLALLSLIYPYDVISREQALKILENVESILVRGKGVIRYVGDKYYNNGSEAEWTFGFPWLAKICKDLGMKKKYRHYMLKTYSALNLRGELPELYFGNTNIHNENTPLGWSHAMAICALT